MSHEREGDRGTMGGQPSAASVPAAPSGWVAFGVVLTTFSGLLATRFATAGEYLPKDLIVEGINADKYSYQLVTGPYFFTLLFTTLLAVKLRTWIGSDSIFRIGMILSGMGYLGGALSMSVPEMAFSRVLWGFKGFAMATSIPQLWRAFPRHRGLAIGCFAAFSFGGIALGFSLGSFMEYQPSWRAGYCVSGIICLLIALFCGHTLIKDTRRLRPEPFDWFGTILMMAWVAALLFILYRGRRLSWFASPQICVATVLCGVSFAAFIVREATHAVPVLHVRLFTVSRSLWLVLVVNFFYAAVFRGIFSNFSGYFNLRGYQSVDIGLIILPGALCMIAAGILSGLFTEKKYHLGMSWTGLALMAGATWSLAKVDLFVSKQIIMAEILVFCVGSGMTLPSLTKLLYEGLDIDQVTKLAAIKTSVSLLGVYVGILFAANLTDFATDKAVSYIGQDINSSSSSYLQAEAKLEQAFAASGQSPVTAAWMADHVIRQSVEDMAEAVGYQALFRYYSMLCLVALLCALCVRRQSLKSIFSDEESVWGRLCNALFGRRMGDGVAGR